jgi:hypothetical protein
MITLTPAGAQAEELARWAWQDPPARLADALSQVLALSRAADSADAAAQTGDVLSMLTRLAGAVAPDAAAAPATISHQAGLAGGTITSQLDLAATITGQLDLASVNGHHVPHTDYTFRHGWLRLGPLAIGRPFNDKYPQWLIDKNNETKAKAKLSPAEAVKAAKMAAPPPASRKLAPAPPSAAARKLTPEQKAMVADNKSRQAQAAAAVRVAGANQAIAAHSGLPRTAPMTRINPAVSEAAAAAKSPAQQTMAALKSDPALNKITGPGADTAALKTYIDARIAAEVARQVGEITAAQQKDINARFAALHASQAKMAKLVREGEAEGAAKENADLAKHTIMNNLFNLGLAGAVLAPLTLGVSPLIAAVVAGVIPMVNIIHDYVRNLG